MKNSVSRMLVIVSLVTASAAACAGFSDKDKHDGYVDNRTYPQTSFPGYQNNHKPWNHDKNNNQGFKWPFPFPFPGHGHGYTEKGRPLLTQLGPRPYFLVDDMDEGPLKNKLASCENKPQQPSKFSIGHRGAGLMIPEHTREGYIAAARMGAGIMECDVTFTKDKELVCRHSQCDLHTTTNILATDLAQKCTVPPEFDADGKLTNAGAIQCCTSDITVAEFKSLQGKMDSANTRATSIAEYMNATPAYRTDLYAIETSGTLMTHKESIQLFNELGVDFTPELKSPSVQMPFDGDYTQEDYAQQMINEYKEAGIDPDRVWPQSFDYGDIKYWIDHEPAFGRQAAYLLQTGLETTTLSDMRDWYHEGVRVIAPATFMLVDVDPWGRMVASDYAKNARAAGLKTIAWTLERSGPLSTGGGWYYSTVNGSTGGENIINNDGDMYTLLDVLARDAGVIGVFSDWPATTTYYANCMK